MSTSVSSSATGPLVRRLVTGYVRRYWRRLALALVCMAVVALATAAMTQLMKPIINEVFVARNADMLLPIALAALAVFAAKGIATYGQGVLMSFVGFRIVADIQQQLFDRLVEADLGFFHSTPPGGLVARFINDVNLLRRAVSDTLTGIGKDTLTALALIAVMFKEDWLLASLAFLAFPTAIYPITRIGRRMRKVSGSTQVQVGLLTGLLDEVFQGIRHVKAYGMEGFERARANDAVETVFQLNQKAARTRNALHPIMELLGGLAIVAVILYGGSRVIDGVKDPGSFFAFITALLLAYEPMKRLARLNANLQEGLAAAERVFEVIDSRPEIRDRPGAQEIGRAAGAISFQDVSFAYHEKAPALFDLDIEIAAGETVALVGLSGAGKSTVLNLIPRFYDVDAGAIRLDGTDIRDLTLESLRRQVALVSQEIILFDDTLKANIAYGRPEASQAEIEAVARAAGAHDFIAALPEGYETRVGPRGAKLSGGQRQRVAIARAMLKEAPILLLDEATSALDSESERHVQGALAELMVGRTTLVIAHRLSTVREADRIYVLDKGRVIEEGRHAELLAKGGAYARLHALQFAEGAALETPLAAEA